MHNLPKFQCEMLSPVKNINNNKEQVRDLSAFGNAD